MDYLSQGNRLLQYGNEIKEMRLSLMIAVINYLVESDGIEPK